MIVSRVKLEHVSAGCVLANIIIAFFYIFSIGFSSSFIYIIGKSTPPKVLPIFVNLTPSHIPTD